jgi:hypothetical protein
MSAREMLKNDIDVMPDEVVEILQSVWLMAKKHNIPYFYEVPNAETISAFDETDYNSHDNVDDLLRSLSRFENEES